MDYELDKYVSYLFGKSLQSCVVKDYKYSTCDFHCVSRSASTKDTRHCSLSLVTPLISLKMLFFQNIIRSIGLHVKKRANLTSVWHEKQSSAVIL